MSARLVLTSMPTGEITITSAPSGSTARMRPSASIDAGVHVVERARQHRRGVVVEAVGVEEREVPELVSGHVRGAEREPGEVEARPRAGRARRRRRPGLARRAGGAAARASRRRCDGRTPRRPASGFPNSCSRRSFSLGGDPHRCRTTRSCSCHPHTSVPGGTSVGRAALVGVDREGARPVRAEAFPDRRRRREVAHEPHALIGRPTTGTGRRARARRAARRCRASAARRPRTRSPGPRGRATCPARAGRRAPAAARRRAGVRARRCWRRRTAGW